MKNQQIWTIYYADQVVKQDIPRLDHVIAKRIKRAIEAKLMVEPIHFGKPLRYSLSHLRSLRVGDYRVLYTADHDSLCANIVAIRHRREEYD